MKEDPKGKENVFEGLKLHVIIVQGRSQQIEKGGVTFVRKWTLSKIHVRDGCTMSKIRCKTD